MSARRGPGRPTRQLLSADQERTARELWIAGGSRDEVARAVGVTIDVLQARMADQLKDLPRRGRGGNRRDPQPDPTPEEIAARAAELRATWTPDRWLPDPREPDPDLLPTMSRRNPFPTRDGRSWR